VTNDREDEREKTDGAETVDEVAETPNEHAEGLGDLGIGVHDGQTADRLREADAEIDDAVGHREDPNA
jgi:hypothetical protein